MRLLPLILLLLCGACAQERVHRGVVVASADTTEVIEVAPEPPRQLYDVYADGKFVAVVEGEEQEDGSFEIFAESPFQTGDRVEVFRHASVKTPEKGEKKKDAEGDETKRRLLRFKIEPEQAPAQK
jgi:hypothetical protein